MHLPILYIYTLCVLSVLLIENCFPPAQDKTYNKTCVTSKDQPVQLSSMARVYPSLDSADAQTDRRFH